MTKEELAQHLNGREIGAEINPTEETHAKHDGLVVAFGYSDDNVEFRGAMDDEVGAYNGTEIYLVRKGPLPDHRDCDCPYCGFLNTQSKAKIISAIWGEDGVSWQFKTDVPHATFEVLEDDEVFCRGIVFHIDDIEPPCPFGP